MLDAVLPLTFSTWQWDHFLKEQRCPKAPQPRLSQLTTGKMFMKSLYMVGFSTAQQPAISPEVQFCPVIHEVGHFMSQARQWAGHESTGTD